MNGLAIAAILVGGSVVATAAIVFMIIGLMAWLGAVVGGAVAIGVVVIALFLLTWWMFR